MVKLSKEKFREACKDTGGILTVIAEKLHVTRKAVYDWLDKNPQERQYIEAAEEAIIDLAENKLFNKINSGDPKAITFFLERKGKRRGYAQKIEQETELRMPDVKLNGPIEVIRVLKKEDELLENKEDDSTEHP